MKSNVSYPSNVFRSNSAAVSHLRDPLQQPSYIAQNFNNSNNNPQPSANPLFQPQSARQTGHSVTQPFQQQQQHHPRQHHRSEEQQDPPSKSRRSGSSSGSEQSGGGRRVRDHLLGNGLDTQIHPQQQDNAFFRGPGLFASADKTNGTSKHRGM